MVRTNKHSKRPSSMINTRLCVTRNVPSVEEVEELLGVLFGDKVGKLVLTSVADFVADLVADLVFFWPGICLCSDPDEVRVQASWELLVKGSLSSL